MQKADLLVNIKDRDGEIKQVNEDQSSFLNILLLGFILLVIAKVVFPEKWEFGLIALAIFNHGIGKAALFGWFIHRSGAYKGYLENKLENHYQDENAGDPNKVFQAEYWEVWKNKSNIYTGVINVIAFIPLGFVLLWAVGLPVFGYLGNFYYAIMGLITLGGFYFLIFAPRIAKNYISSI